MLNIWNELKYEKWLLFDQISGYGQVINIFFFFYIIYAYQPVQRLVLPNIFLKSKQIYNISANLSIMLDK